VIPRGLNNVKFVIRDFCSQLFNVTLFQRAGVVVNWSTSEWNVVHKELLPFCKWLNNWFYNAESVVRCQLFLWGPRNSSAPSYESRRNIILPTRTHYSSKQIQPAFHPLISETSRLILPSHLPLRVPCVVFLSKFPTKHF
jgi:hypothetical protein